MSKIEKLNEAASLPGPESMWTLARELLDSQLFAEFFLWGGCALALYLRHRPTDDIDLYTQNALDHEEITSYFSSRHSVSCEKINEDYIRTTVRGCQVCVCSLQGFPLVESAQETLGLRCMGIKDMAAIKLEAVCDNGTRIKDFVDVYYLLEKLPLEEIIGAHKKRYGTAGAAHILRFLACFDDVPAADWDSLELVDTRLTPDRIQSRLSSAVREYREGGRP
jgi:hypothetical protein